ncbi:HAMP domain-containing protein [Curvibacter sp. APW13]|uniref:HAMP domain-containing protein n=1 Tax=Curvibacter sp. APW13 TaxID=3077236 RepID=UPI0028DFF15B|nr:HAMP domain-containing protein [Curvibacter sp. APW13]MDT8990189.1 HAMP domain-containing protein [Curvibacter sp. APW13]
MFLQKLYVRIWLAVVGTVAVLTLLVGFVWRMAAEPPLREVVVRDAQGQVIGAGQRQPGPPPWMRPGEGLGRPTPPVSAPEGEAPTPRGPEFVVLMHDGQTLHMHLPRPPRNGWLAPMGFAWTLGLVALAVALATYPIVRRLTRNLEQLQRGVQRLGEGDLKVRVPVQGRDEVAFLAQRFNHSAERIEALVQAQANVLASQKALLANASHELRSPLARIRMGLELLGSGPGDAGSQALHDELVRNIAELDSLVDELLLASRLDAQQTDLGTVEVVDMVALVAEECARASVVLDVAPDTVASVQGVAVLLRRMVRNLLQSAQRVAHAGSAEARLRLDGTSVCLAVRDPSLQLAPGQLEQPFQPFWRAPGASERDGGVGLALALVRAIAMRFGGVATARIAAEGGAWLEVRLPVRATT